MVFITNNYRSKHSLNDTIVQKTPDVLFTPPAVGEAES